MKEICYIGFFLSLISLTLEIQAQKGNFCGELKATLNGPFDYLERAQLEKHFNIVEIFHFTEDIEKLRGSARSVAPDLNYTLTVIPNHHRALASLAKLAIREKTSKIPGLKYNVECYFERAIRWRSNDSIVRTIYGSYLSKIGRTNNAIEQFEIAIRLQSDNATAHYNLGLLYFDKANYDKALFHAERTYDLNFPLPGLRNKLIKIGKWKK